MASLVLGTVAAAVLGPAGFAVMGAQSAFLLGSLAGSLLFPPKLPDGPRLNDLSVQVSTYGQGITRVYGRARVAGNVIWATDLVEHANEEGGKGGPSYTTYTYTCSFAVSLCEGPIVGIRRLWCDGKLMFDITSGNTGPIAAGEGLLGKVMTDSYNSQTIGFKIYTGTETQQVDPTIQAHMGDAPAYRGQAYLVFTDLELERFGNRIPNITAEVVVDGSFAQPAPLAIGSGAYGVMQPGTPYFWGTVIDSPSSAETTVYITDIHTQQLVKSFVIPVTDGQRMDYVALGDEMWVARAAPANQSYEVTALSAGGMVASRTIEFNNSSFRWYGLPRYCSTTSEVYIASTGGISKAISVIRPSDGAVLAEFNGDFYAHEILDLAEIGGMSFVGDVSGSGDAQRIMLVDAGSRSIRYIFESPTYSGLAQDRSHHAWDSARSRIIWTHEETFDHFYLLDAASDLTGGPVQTFWPVAPGEAIKTILYHEQLDRFVAQGTSTTYIINPETWLIEESFNQGQTANELHEVDGVFDYVLATFNNTLYRYYLSPRLTPNAVAVSSILTDISGDVSLSASDINVTDLADTLCSGFVIARPGTARSSVEQLMMAYQFDAVESDGKVKFVRRGKKTPVVLDSDRMGMHEPGQDVPPQITLTRADEVELPRSIAVKYINPGADYQTGVQMASRQTGRSVNDVVWELPVVMTDSEAMAVAEAGEYSAWAARTTAKWTTSLKYIDYEPTDVFDIDGNIVRATKRNTKGNILEWEGALDSGTVFATGSAAGESYPVSQTIPLRSATLLHFLDIQALRDFDNDAGPYVAACGYSGMDWPGCVIFKSSDGGASWDEVATITAAATIGAATTALGSFAQNVFDESNTVTIRLTNGTLSSISELSVLNGGNTALIGDEIIQFKTATLNGDGTYTLRGLLRERNGTSSSGHVIGDRFILLNTSTIRRIDSSTSEIGLERIYRAVTLGGTINSANNVTFTNAAVSLECLSGVHLGGGRDASGNITINWVRRTRLGGEWRDYADVPVSEAAESYEVEVWTSGYGTLKRTITGLSSPTTSYSAANQTTDFGGTQSTVYLRVYQLSATVGRGFVLQGAV